MKFIKVNESRRIYYFPNNEKIVLNNIVSINVSKSGTHRINTMDGKKHIVSPKWFYIEFHAKKWTF